MKRSVIITAVISILILVFAWFAPHSLFSVKLETATTPQESISATSTPQVETTSIQESVPTNALYGTLIKFQNISFIIPAGLAGSADSATAPALDNDMMKNPAYIRFVLKDYPVTPADDYYKPEIRVYPAADYAAVNVWAAETQKRLQTVLSNPNSPFDNATLPYPSYRGSTAQLYTAQVKIIPFQSGNGVRMISSYAQFPAPISQNESIYHYEGLTKDGRYYLVVDMPVILPVYSDASNPGENGITYARGADWASVDPYYNAMTDLLNAASPEGFNPMLTRLDLLVQSITITN